MIRSMTGFGRGQRTAEGFLLRAEIRSVNNRSLRVVFRLPERLQPLEQDFERVVREGGVVRGSVSVTFSVDDTSGDPGYLLDANALTYYRDTIRKMGGEEAPLSVLLSLPGTVRKKSTEEVPEAMADAARKALADAVAEMVAQREKEGAFLWNDMLAHAGLINELVERVERRLPKMVDEYRRRLTERLAKLLAGIGSTVTEEDVRREVVLFTDRCDISEEITRMRSHLALLEEAGRGAEAIGRKLEFIMQEMFREANTMGSKSNDPEMIHDILDVKSEVEKLREQALNVE